MVMEIKKKRKKYEKVMSNLHKRLGNLLNRSRKDIKDYQKQINPVSGTAPPNCGSMQYNPPPAESENDAQAKRTRKKAQDKVAAIIEELERNKIKFPDARDMLPPKDKQGPGAGKGGMRGVIEVPALTGKPPWFKEIIGALGEAIGKPERGRKGIDYESAQTYIEQGVMITRKPRAKVRKPNKQIYVLMDQSGSMGQHAWKGFSYLELLGSYVPSLANYYEGEFWVCDSCTASEYERDSRSVPNDWYPLQDVTKDLIVNGGGGTEFEGAFLKLGDIEREKMSKDPKYEMCVIFFSDMMIDDDEFALYEKYGPSKIMFVTTKQSVEYLRPFQWIWTSDKHKVIQIEMDEKD